MLDDTRCISTYILCRDVPIMVRTTACARPPPSAPLPQRSATRALGQLLGDCHAVAAMLHCYSRKIAVQQGVLLKQLAAGGGVQALGFKVQGV